MTYVGGLMAREDAVLRLAEQHWQAGLKPQAWEGLRNLIKETTVELAAWQVTRDHIELLTRYLSNPTAEEALSLLDTYVKELQQRAMRLGDVEPRYAVDS